MIKGTVRLFSDYLTKLNNPKMRTVHKLNMTWQKIN